MLIGVSGVLLVLFLAIYGCLKASSADRDTERVRVK